MFYKEKVIKFEKLKHPVTVFALCDHEGLAVGVKTLTLDDKEYSVSTPHIQIKFAVTEEDFADFYKQMLGDASEYSEDLLVAAKDIQTRTSDQLLEYLFGQEFNIKEC